MDNRFNFDTPTTLVIEYNSVLLIVRGVISIVIIIALLTMTKALSNILAVILLSFWFAIASLSIKKAYFNTALIITVSGIKINDKHIIGWNLIENFSIKTVIVDGTEAEKLIINSRSKNFTFDMGDLNIDKEALNSWIKFYKQIQKKN
jgi:hypothetical protein